jgi:hypothetical protein
MPEYERARKRKEEGRKEGALLLSFLSPDSYLLLLPTSTSLPKSAVPKGRELPNAWCCLPPPAAANASGARAAAAAAWKKRRAQKYLKEVVAAGVASKLRPDLVATAAAWFVGWFWYK